MGQTTESWSGLVVNLPLTWDIHCPNFYSKRSQQWSKKKGENRSDKEKDKIFKHTAGFFGLFSFFSFFGFLGPGEIGSPWSSLPHPTGRVAFHPVRFRYRASWINFFGLVRFFGLLNR